MNKLFLYIIYCANIIVAGWISITSMFFTETAASTVFSNAYETTEVMKLVGCLWFAIAMLSVFGLWRPLLFSPVLILQVIYKGSWLLFVALPALADDRALPGGMAVFFLVWVIVLPFVIPWKMIFKDGKENENILLSQKVQ